MHSGSAESVLQTLEPDEAREILEAALGSSVEILDLSGTNQEEIRARISAIRTGVELWNVFLGLALLMLLAEMVVEKKWRPEAA